MTALRIVCLTLAVGILALLGWRASAPVTRPVAPLPAPRATLDGAVGPDASGGSVASPPAPPAAYPAGAGVPASGPTPDAPEFAGFYGRLRAEFPHDRSATRSEAAASPDAAIWEALRDLEQSRGVLAAEAEAPTLDRFFDARSAVLGSLAPGDARRCVDFLYGVTDGSIADFTAAHRGLVATLADRTLAAITDGRLHHVQRAPPTPADLDDLATALGSFGLAPAEIALLIDGIDPDPPLPDRRLCEVGRTYLDVLRGMPADARQRIYGLAAKLLARS